VRTPTAKSLPGRERELPGSVMFDDTCEVDREGFVYSRRASRRVRETSIVACSRFPKIS